MRLIDKDALIEEIREEYFLHDNRKLIIGLIEQQPSAEPEIIYCKDCDQYNPEAQFCDLLQFNFLPEGHCSWGRRKKRAL